MLDDGGIDLGADAVDRRQHEHPANDDGRDVGCVDDDHGAGDHSAGSNDRGDDGRPGDDDPLRQRGLQGPGQLDLPR